MTSVFLLFFAALLITVELRLGSALFYIEFLRSRYGKGIYLILVGVLVFDSTKTADSIIAILILLIGFFNIMVSCMRNDRESSKRSKREEITSD